MKKVSDQEGALREAFCSIGQGHVFRFWNELNSTQRKYLLKQLKEISPLDCKSAWNDMQTVQNKLNCPKEPNFVSAVNPLCKKLSKFREIGEELLSTNKVAAFTVAGGQGTRLGHNGPKGTYKCTPITKVSLFEKFAQNMHFFSKRYGQSPMWFIMTSKENHEDTVNFFTHNNYFGLERDRVTFFKQGMMPVFDLQGKILLKEKHEILMSPNGHGGSFRAMLDSGALSQMEQQKIDYISYFQIDNPLVYCLDPTFIGLHYDKKSEMSSKAVQKLNPSEKVGTFVNLGDQLHVVEYSDIPQKMSDERKEDGGLRYRLGSVAIHLINRSFVKKVTTNKETPNRLTYHGALKAVNHLDEDGKYIEADSPNALKPETFVFDALPLAQNPLVVEIDRSEEFAPIKNAHGQDSLKSSHQLQLDRARKWFKEEKFETVPKEIEISPSFAPTWPHFVEQISTNRPEQRFLSKHRVIFDEFGISKAI